MTDTTNAPSIRDLADELDVSTETIETLAGQLADDPDLYGEDGLTAAGADLIREQVRSGASDADPLEEVQAAKDALDEAKSQRDAAVRRAFLRGVPRALIAEAAGISRERVYQIVQGR